MTSTVSQVRAVVFTTFIPNKCKCFISWTEIVNQHFRGLDVWMCNSRIGLCFASVFDSSFADAANVIFCISMSWSSSAIILESSELSLPPTPSSPAVLLSKLQYNVWVESSRLFLFVFSCDLKCNQLLIKYCMPFLFFQIHCSLNYRKGNENPDLRKCHILKVVINSSLTNSNLD